MQRDDWRLNLPGFGLPAGYVSRAETSYFDDAPNVESDIVHQPEVYDAADYLVATTGRTTIIDIGCGNGRKLRGVSAARHIGIDFGSNLALCRERFGGWGEWIEADFSRPDCIALAELAGQEAVVVCADVVEHLLQPQYLVALLAACYDRGAIVVTSTPDRIRVHGSAHDGPPRNPAHIREWALEEYVGFLTDHGLPAIHAGYTLNNNVARQLRTIVTLHDAAIDRARSGRAGEPDRPIAILSAYNEADVISEVVEDLLDQGCDVAAIDNWSTDETWTILTGLAAREPAHMTIERFPAEGPIAHCEWQQILERKEVIAQSFPGHWIIHTDADELRRSPFPDLTLAEALDVARRNGANRVDFTLVNFRPVEDRASSGGGPLGGLSHFEYGTRLGHFRQAKAWLQGAQRVDLTSIGGHVASFPGAVDFRYKFLLRHYPIRSPAHGRRKVFSDRRDRWSPAERANGLHIQYDEFSEASSFLWKKEELHEFNPCFWREHGLPIMTDIAERRFERSKP